MQEILMTQLPIKDLEIIIEKSIQKAIKENFPPSNFNESNTPDILSINEASSLLNLAKPTIYCLVSNSKIPYMKKGKKLYFSKTELTEWIKAGRRKTIDEKELSLKISSRKTRK